jgi:hypothetical protein
VLAFDVVKPGTVGVNGNTTLCYRDAILSR